MVEPQQKDWKSFSALATYCLSESTSSKENFRTQKSEIKKCKYIYGPRSHTARQSGARPDLPASFPIQRDSPTLNKKKKTDL